MDLSVLAAESGMSAGEAFSISSTGMIVVLIVLIVLAVLVLLISKGVRAAQGKSKQTEEASAVNAPVSIAQSAAPAAPAVPAAPVVNGVPLPENQSAGQLELYDFDEKSAAVIMAIISNESGIPLNHLEFKSIKDIEE